MHYNLLENKIGALVTALSDILASPKTSSSSAAALFTILHHQPITVTALSDILGLSQPATSRLVQGLQNQELVERDIATSRKRALALTRQGVAEAKILQETRLETIAKALETLNESDREVLNRVVSTVLAHLAEGPEHARRMCRYCDHDTCDGALCPVGSEIRKRAKAEESHDSRT